MLRPLSTRLAVLLVVAFLGSLVPAVLTASPAAAALTCRDIKQSPGFGTQRVCQFNSATQGSGLSGKAYWFYDSGAKANTGNLVFTVRDTEANDRCAFARVENDFDFGVFYEVCGRGRTKQFHVPLGEGYGVADRGYYRLQVCTAKVETRCSTVWSQRIGQAPPR